MKFGKKLKNIGKKVGKKIEKTGKKIIHDKKVKKK